MGWWDGSGWSQLPVAPQYVTPYAPVALVARLAQVLIGAVGALIAVALVVEVRVYRNAQDIDLSQSITAFFSNGSGTALAMNAAVRLGVVVAGIAFLVWRHRIQVNLCGAMPVSRPEYTPGWAVGWWFVPLANLVKPKQAMDEAWLASDPLLPAGATGWRGRRVNPILGWWWAAWILSWLAPMVFGWIVRIGSLGSSEPRQPGDLRVTAEDIRLGAVGDLIGLGLLLVAAVLAIAVVETITARHRARARALGIASA